MKKTIKEPTFEMWVTRDRRGRLIRVYQVNKFVGDLFENEKNLLSIPICVDYTGYGESLADILEERENLKEKVSKLEQEKVTRDNDRLSKLEDKVFSKRENKQKWRIFWR